LFFSLFLILFFFTLFPYTTLFRSLIILVLCDSHSSNSDNKSFVFLASRSKRQTINMLTSSFLTNCITLCMPSRNNDFPELSSWRSEEHTSELQSRFDLVCRLLLEK